MQYLTHGTISFWVCFDKTLKAADAFGGIVNTESLSLWMRSNLSIYLYDGPNDYVVSSAISTKVNYGEWNFIAITINNGIMDLFLNGQDWKLSWSRPNGILIDGWGIGGLDSYARRSFCGKIANFVIQDKIYTSVPTTEIRPLMTLYLRQNSVYGAK